MQKIKPCFILVLLTALLFMASDARTETIRSSVQSSDTRSSSSADPLAPFLGNPGRSAAAQDGSVETGLPAWAGSRQEASAESKLGWALWEMTQKTSGAAKAVKETVKTSITDYVKDKQKQMRQQDLVEKFYTNLQYVTANLHLAPQDQQELTSRIQHVYIEDAESGRYELDSLHFSQLPYIVRKEYADMVMSRTENGEAETYHLNGTLKTRWNLKNGQPDGPIVTYYENGDINFIDVFKDGRKIRRTKYDLEGKQVFEQNYEYNLPAENPSGAREAAPVEKEAAALKTPEPPADVPSKTSPRQETESEPEAPVPDPEPSPRQDTSGLVELPPQVSPNLIEV